MKNDKPLHELLVEIHQAIIQKDKAERARVHAEERKAKAHWNYTHLMDTFRHGEYKII